MEDVLLKLKELDMKIVNRGNKRLGYEENDEIVSVDWLLTLIDELVDEVDGLEERYEDLQSDVDEYYVLRRDAIEDYE